MKQLLTAITVFGIILIAGSCVTRGNKVSVTKASYLDQVSPANGARGKMFEFEITIGKNVEGIVVDSLWVDGGRFAVLSGESRDGKIRVSGSYMEDGPNDVAEGEVRKTQEFPFPITSDAQALLRYWHEEKPYFLEIKEVVNRKSSGEEPK
jgi:hypothetical protein